jgi:hypothetical protein
VDSFRNCARGAVRPRRLLIAGTHRGLADLD